jgi:GT2 family glycosyltransferase
MVTSLPVSVVLPTIGRTELLASCLRSIAACDPQPDDVVVVDQSADGIADLVARAHPRARVVRSLPLGIGAATNTGCRSAAHDLVLVTHDDCTVAADWVAASFAALRESVDALVSGRVLPPPGTVGHVPSTRTDDQPQRWRGMAVTGVLYPCNMALDRRALFALGGFDERASLRLAAEDNDLCFRWLAEGREVRFDPAMVVWHHDWRSPSEVRRTYARYARGQGAFYAKHVLRGDRRIAAAIVWDARAAVRVRLGRVAPTDDVDFYRALVPGAAIGFLQGLRDEFRARRSAPRASVPSDVVSVPSTRSR